MFLPWRAGAVAALLVAPLAIASCDKHDDYCPGLCPVDSTHPTMTIEVAGGAAILAKAVVSGPCSHLLVKSSGEAGAPTGYAAVQVTYNGTTTPPLPLCLIEVTTLDGQATDVTAEAKATTAQSACCPKGTCCAQSQAISVHQTVAFTQSVQTVAFQPRDAGTVDSADDSAMDGTTTIDSESLDGDALDAGAVDAAESDSAALDSPALDSAASDESDESVHGAVDGGAALDLPVQR